MNFYWVYDLPNWLFGTLTIGAFVLFGVIGLHLTRNWVRRLHQIDHSHNDIVGYYLSAVTVFYGITLGLVAVGTWNTFSDVQNKVDIEAQLVASLYRDVSSYDDPWKSELQQDLQDYAKQVIEVSWPQQRKGIVPAGSGRFLTAFQTHMISFKPTTMSEEINQAEVLKQYNLLIEARRARLNAVTTGLPQSLWSLVILGGLVSIIVTFFFDTRSFGMHLWMTILLSGLLGLIIFLVGTLDNPFRGDVSVGPQALTRVYDMMTKQKSLSPSPILVPVEPAP